jgi:hypothetical protein
VTKPEFLLDVQVVARDPPAQLRGAHHGAEAAPLREAGIVADQRTDRAPSPHQSDFAAK